MVGSVKKLSLILVSALLVGCGGGGAENTPEQNTANVPLASSKTVTITQNDSSMIVLEGSANGNVTYAVTSLPSHGILVGTPPNVIYVPDSDFSGTDSFSHTVTNSYGTSAPATVTIEINGTTPPANNIAPIAIDYNVTTEEDHNVSAPMAGVDRNGDSLSYTVVTAPQHGNYDAANGIYTPTANYHGSDSFTYTANDGTVDSAPATVNITVTSVNDAPVADDVNVTTNEDNSVAVNLAATDADGDSLTYRVTSAPVHGSFDVFSLD
jgi:VCBS repeat-containing protein